MEAGLSIDECGFANYLKNEKKLNSQEATDRLEVLRKKYESIIDKERHVLPCPVPYKDEVEKEQVKTLFRFDEPKSVDDDFKKSCVRCSKYPSKGSSHTIGTITEI